MSKLQYGIKPKVKRHKDWPKVRLKHLLANPQCAACGKEVSRYYLTRAEMRGALEVHHIIPVHVSIDLELDPENLLTLCESHTLNCHLWCGHLGYWPSWNVNATKDAATFYKKVLTRPLITRVDVKPTNPTRFVHGQVSPQGN